MSLILDSAPRFFMTIHNAWGGLSQEQVDAINGLLTYMQADTRISDVRQFAYMFATVKHETADTYRPIEEYGHGHGHPYGQPDPITGQIYDGRGDVQLTWKVNYQKVAVALDIPDLVANPKLAMQPDYAYAIMSYGMTKGLFTGHMLSDYINYDGCDYFHARRIINGMDKAQLIADYAAIFEKALT